MAFECFEKFKQDKNLDSWHVRVMEATATSDNGDSSLSITALDFLLSQMSTMCDIVQQYYKFLSRTFLSIDIDMDGNKEGENRLEMAMNGDYAVQEKKRNELDELASGVHIDLIITAQEKNRQVRIC